MSQSVAPGSDITRAAVAGDAAAFGELVRLHQGAIRGLCRRLAGSHADGDDLAQSAFLTAWRRIETFKGGSFRAWVGTIAFREFLRLRRLTPSHFEPLDEAADASGPSGAEGERLDLERALSALSLGERASVSLCLGVGMTHEEAAGAMMLPVGTVKSHVSRGRAKLKRLLSAYVEA